MNNTGKIQKNTAHCENGAHYNGGCIVPTKETNMDRWMRTILDEACRQNEVIEKLDNILSDVRHCYPCGNEKVEDAERWGGSALANGLQRICMKTMENTERLLYIIDTIEIK